MDASRPDHPQGGLFVGGEQVPVKLVQVCEDVYSLEGGSNVGFIVREGQALVVDMGMDRDMARRAVRSLRELEAEPVGLVITHAHADHFGGAADFVRRTGVPVFASALEAAVIRNPILEPIYLYGGATPPPALRQKFLLAPPCPVAQEIEPGPLVVGGIAVKVVSLPGHAPAQVGLVYGGVLFSADAYFPEDVLTKHGVPFFYDFDAALKTLEWIGEGEYKAHVAGHGPWRASARDVVQANRERLLEIRAWALEAVGEPQETEALVAGLAGRYGLHLTTPAQFVLTRGSLLAALSSLVEAGEVETAFADGRLVWRRA